MVSDQGDQAGTAAGKFEYLLHGLRGENPAGGTGNFQPVLDQATCVLLRKRRYMVAADNSFQVRDTMCMTLSADHRAVDGVLGSKFVNHIKYGLENPQNLLG